MVYNPQVIPYEDKELMARRDRKIPRSEGGSVFKPVTREYINNKKEKEHNKKEHQQSHWKQG